MAKPPDDSGSRHLGLEIANFYQEAGFKALTSYSANHNYIDTENMILRNVYIAHGWAVD